MTSTIIVITRLTFFFSHISTAHTRTTIQYTYILKSITLHSLQCDPHCVRVPCELEGNLFSSQYFQRKPSYRQPAISGGAQRPALSRVGKGVKFSCSPHAAAYKH